VRAVVDINVLLSGLFWHGPPHLLLEQIRNGRLTLVSSPGLLADLADVLGRPKFQAVLTRSGTRAEAVLAELSQLAEIIDSPPLPAPVSRDPDDDAVLALAVASQVDLVIVTRSSPAFSGRSTKMHCVRVHINKRFRRAADAAAVPVSL
jgi:putative PIN family toxin of toxin-antitoxin system